MGWTDSRLRRRRGSDRHRGRMSEWDPLRSGHRVGTTTLTSKTTRMKRDSRILPQLPLPCDGPKTSRRFSPPNDRAARGLLSCAPAHEPQPNSADRHRVSSDLRLADTDIRVSLGRSRHRRHRCRPLVFLGSQRSGHIAQCLSPTRRSRVGAEPDRSAWKKLFPPAWKRDGRGRWGCVLGGENHFPRLKRLLNGPAMRAGRSLDSTDPAFAPSAVIPISPSSS